MCVGNSFGYLPAGEMADFVAAAAAAIRPNGWLVLDTSSTAESLLPGFGEELRMTTGDIDVVATHDYDAAGRC